VAVRNAALGTWQWRLPPELRLAGITTAENANAFLRQRYIGEFNSKFKALAEEKGTHFGAAAGPT
jgi:hypothetical protein